MYFICFQIFLGISNKIQQMLSYVIYRLSCEYNKILNHSSSSTMFLKSAFFYLAVYVNKQNEIELSYIVVTLTSLHPFVLTTKRLLLKLKTVLFANMNIHDSLLHTRSI